MEDLSDAALVLYCTNIVGEEIHWRRKASCMALGFGSRHRFGLFRAGFSLGARVEHIIARRYVMSGGPVNSCLRSGLF